MTSRDYILQQFLNRRPHPSYLEIGVARGSSFFPVRASRKVAVDPRFRFPFYKRLHPRELLCSHFYPVTSDEFFQNSVQLYPAGFDVIYIDGLHTHAQTMKDVENSLLHLKPDGRIVLHDCNPTSAEMAVPAMSYAEAKQKNPPWPGDWCGDCWKTVVKLRSTRADLDIVVFDCCYGVGVVKRVDGQSAPLKNKVDTATLTYEDLARNRQEWLNLYPESEIDRVLGFAGS